MIRASLSCSSAYLQLLTCSHKLTLAKLAQAICVAYTRAKQHDIWT